MMMTTRNKSDARNNCFELVSVTTQSMMMMMMEMIISVLTDIQTRAPVLAGKSLFLKFPDLKSNSVSINS